MTQLFLAIRYVIIETVSGARCPLSYIVERLSGIALWKASLARVDVRWDATNPHGVSSMWQDSIEVLGQASGDFVQSSLGGSHTRGNGEVKSVYSLAR